MKKLMLFLFLILSTYGIKQSFAQCPIEGPTTFFNDQTVTFSTPSATGVGHFWSASGIIQIDSGGTTPTVTVSPTDTAGTGRICVTSFAPGVDPCCNCINVTINTRPIPPTCITPTSIFVGQNDELSGGCRGTKFTFDVTLTPSNAEVGNLSFFWEAGTGALGQGIFLQRKTNGPRTSFIVQEEYTWVRVTFTSPCDNSTYTAFTFVTFLSTCPEINGGQADRLLEVDSERKPEVKVHPNPFRQQINFDLALEAESEVQVDLYDSKGQLLFSRRYDVGPGKQQIQLNDLSIESSGLLYYQLHTSGRTLSSGELIHWE